CLDRGDGRPAAGAARSAGAGDEFGGYQRTPSLASEETAALMSSTCLAPSSEIIRVVPVRFAPGRARLATTPLARGSPIATKTIGVVCVACLAASVACGASVTITST